MATPQFERTSNANSGLRELQRGQLQHDERAHADILALSPERRLTHFGLHFAKYSGQLFRATRLGDTTGASRLMIDSLVIVLATANELDLDLTGEPTFSCLGNGEEELLRLFAEKTADFAKACEAFDHPSENYPSKATICTAIPVLSSIVQALANLYNLDLGAGVLSRWNEIESKAARSSGRVRSVAAA